MKVLYFQIRISIWEHGNSLSVPPTESPVILSSLHKRKTARDT